MRSTRLLTQKDVAMNEESPSAANSTPGRAEEMSIPGKENLSKDEPHSVTNQVTPADSVKAELQQDEEEADDDEQDSHRLLSGHVDSKHVRFGSAAHVANEEEESDTSNSNPSDSPSQRGLVSKRGRYVSPGRRNVNTSSPRSDAVLEYKTFRSPPRKREDHEVPSLCSTNSGALCEKDKEGKPTSSISCDQNAMDNTSPLTSHDASDRKNEADPADREDGHTTPTRNTELQITEGLGDHKFGSPGGMILASHSPMPMNRGGMIKVAASFEEKKETAHEELKPSPRRDREHFVATPTDFALDYGKDHHASGSFDTSNVLAWLQSPTSNGLFSPGGFGSIMNTPGARTPRTPTVSTSFFFSDVASLPRGENFSPKDGANSRSQKGISNIICISPLASSRTRNGTSTTNTPNFKEIFSSPQEKSKIRGLPLLNETPSKGRPQIPQRSASKDPSLDAVHLAERDVMEDEDMNVLLQLASNTPGRSAGTGGGPVFRSPSGRKKNDEVSENLPTLQLPMIGGREGEQSSTTLSRKANSRDQADAGDFIPPTLGMRSNSSSCSKEILVGSNLKDKLKAGSPSRLSKESKGSKKSSSNQYSMHQPPYPDVPYYVMPPPDGMRQGMPPGPGGSMRVVIGGPPPPRDGKSGSPPRMGTSPHRTAPHYPPPPAGMYPPPPPGMFSSYPPHMGYPYQSHYPPPPPPRHMPIYGAQLNSGGGSKSSAKKGKSPKAGKRVGSPLLDPKDPPPSKKAKKTPNGQPKKKRSPQITDRVERQKAAVTIQQVNAASGGKNDRAAALAAAILRGVTMRPSGKWQAQLYFAGKSRYIGVFDSREKAALAYEIAREKLKSGPKDSSGQSTENLVNAARKAAFDGVNEQLK